MEETILAPKSGAKAASAGENVGSLRLTEIAADDSYRVRTTIDEFDRCLGGGVIPGSSVLVGGDPGIGKSTLLLQLAGRLAEAGFQTLYVTGEESFAQIKIRADRLGVSSERIEIACLVDTDQIVTLLNKDHFRFLIIDSVQTLRSPQLESSAGTVSQVRESVAALLDVCQVKEVSAFLIGHVNKEGFLAGPKVLEHMVDVVLYLEGEKNHLFRIVRVEKNRYGPTNEIGIFSIGSAGLKAVDNPSSLFISERSERGYGSVIVPVLEGTRPMLLELQALVSPTSYGYPQRVASGLDPKRLALLLAILEKRERYPLGTRDVFVNLTGGLKIVEPSLDLGVMIALVSSLEEVEVKSDLVVVGEVGLGGEIRPVPQLERRLQEAQRLGFRRAVVPNSPIIEDSALTEMEIMPAGRIADAIKLALA